MKRSRLCGFGLCGFSLGTRLVWLALAGFLFCSPALSDELLPADRDMAAAIDHYVTAKLEQAGMKPVSLASDANLLRRTTLDLVGRIPTAAETHAYLDSTEADRRVKLVDRLIASPGFVRHQANEFNTMLMYGSNANLRSYLETALRENRRWDRMFREMLLGEDGDTDQKGAIQFIKSRVSDLDKLTNETSVAFFGVNVSCAQCHDHPLVPAWTQEHFYGMKSFFNRTFDNGGLMGEREYGIVQYTTTGAEKRDARLMFLTGTVIDEPATAEPNEQQKKEEKNRLEELKKNKQAPPAPAFSRRAQLVEVALRSGPNELLARSLVNQLWSRFFGRGLVTPLDQMHPENKPSHPELLAWLARDTIDHGFDIQRLIRGMLLSDTYARASQWSGENRPADDLFAVGSVRPLSPQQYGTSLRIAATSPDQFEPTAKPDEIEKRIEGLENSGRGLTNDLEPPRADFQISVGEALRFSNDNRVQSELLREGGDGLVGKLMKIPDPDERILTAFWNVFNRPPETDEVAALKAYFDSRQDRPADACRQIVWAMLTSSECRYNY